MNQAVSNLPIQYLNIMQVLDRRTLASITTAGLTDSIYVHGDLKLNTGDKTGPIDYSLSNYLFIPASIMEKAKGDKDWLVKELNQYIYFHAAKRTPTILQINDVESKIEPKDLLNMVVKLIPNIAETQQTDQVNYWLLLKLGDSYDVVLCGRSTKPCE